MTRTRILTVTLAAIVLVTVPVMRAFAGSDARPLPHCAQLGKAIARPAAVPAGFPVPEGTRFSELTTNAAGTRLVLGYAPLGLGAATRWFRREVPQAGYRFTSADAELVEAEARFTGNGILGLWRVNVIRGCTNAVVVTLAFAARPSSAPPPS